jgi:hypothetical protein
MSKRDVPAATPEQPAMEPGARPALPPYEPPRILKRRTVAGVTLASQAIPGPAGSQFPVAG